jgi:hypothetical protein
MLWDYRNYQLNEENGKFLTRHDFIIDHKTFLPYHFWSPRTYSHKTRNFWAMTKCRSTSIQDSQFLRKVFHGIKFDHFSEWLKIIIAFIYRILKTSRFWRKKFYKFRRKKCSSWKPYYWFFYSFVWLWPTLKVLFIIYNISFCLYDVTCAYNFSTKNKWIVFWGKV